MNDTTWIDGQKFGYARTSTTKQDLAVQVEELEAAGCKVVTEQQSGKDVEGRPKFVKLVKELEPGDTLVVYKLDRLSRSLRDVVNLLYDLTERGINFLSLHDPIDTIPKDDPFAEAIRQMTIAQLATFAQLERAFIVARTSAGRAHAKANGVAFGRDPKITPTKLAMARAALDATPKPTVAKVAHDLGVNRATLYRYLADEERAERAQQVVSERTAARLKGKRKGKRAA